MTGDPNTSANGCFNCQHFRRHSARSGYGVCLQPFLRGDSYDVPDVFATEECAWDDRCGKHQQKREKSNG
tara:strand:+ start:330 stop:539 length:210 start_codon:yes stop_codon:yes gene_type:complete